MMDDQIDFFLVMKIFHFELIVLMIEKLLNMVMLKGAGGWTNKKKKNY